MEEKELENQLEEMLYQFFSFSENGARMFENISIRIDKDLEEFEKELEKEDLKIIEI